MNILDSVALMVIRRLAEPPTWMELGSCTVPGLDIDPGDRDHVDRMKQLCDACPVLQQCTEYHKTVNSSRLENGGTELRSVVAHGVDYRRR